MFEVEKLDAHILQIWSHIDHVQFGMVEHLGLSEGILYQVFYCKYKEITTLYCILSVCVVY